MRTKKRKNQIFSYLIFFLKTKNFSYLISHSICKHISGKYFLFTFLSVFLLLFLSFLFPPLTKTNQSIKVSKISQLYHILEIVERERVVALFRSLSQSMAIGVFNFRGWKRKKGERREISLCCKNVKGKVFVKI